MLSDAMENGVHYNSTVTIWAAFKYVHVHRVLFHRNTEDYHRIRSSVSTGFLFRLLCLHVFSSHCDVTHADDTYQREFIGFDGSEKRRSFYYLIWNALEVVNSCKILLWHTTKRPTTHFSFPFFEQSEKKRVPFFFHASRELWLPCLLINL